MYTMVVCFDIVGIREIKSSVRNIGGYNNFKIFEISY